jgi:uncharacterized protein with von Willebrand factor type A (vWA) domain
VPEQAPFVGLLVAFGNELRSAGVAVGSGDVLTYSTALALLDPADLGDLYWVGRTTLLSRREHVPVYDRVFRRFFLDEADDSTASRRTMPRLATSTEATLQIPATEQGPPGPRDDEASLGLMASDVEVLRHKSFAECTADELAALRRIMAKIRLSPPRRCTRRTVRASSGRRPDLRRTLRETMREHGEPSELFWRRRRLRMRCDRWC